MKDRPIASRLARVHDHGERVVVHVDQIEGVLGDVGALGDDHRDRVSDMTDFVGGYRVVGRGLTSLGGEPARESPDSTIDQVLAGVDRDDAFQRLGLSRVDSLDGRVGEGAPLDPDVDHSRKGEVGHVLAVTLEEAWVFDALDRRAHVPAHD